MEGKIKSALKCKRLYSYFSYVTITCTNKKLPVHDHMTHVVITDILSNHEEKGNLHLTLNFIFHCIFTENHAFSQNLYSLL